MIFSLIEPYVVVEPRVQLSARLTYRPGKILEIQTLATYEFHFVIVMNSLIEPTVLSFRQGEFSILNYFSTSLLVCANSCRFAKNNCFVAPREAMKDRSRGNSIRVGAPLAKTSARD